MAAVGLFVSFSSSKHSSESGISSAFPKGRVSSIGERLMFTDLTDREKNGVSCVVSITRLAHAQLKEEQLLHCLEQEGYKGSDLWVHIEVAKPEQCWFDCILRADKNRGRYQVEVLHAKASSKSIAQKAPYNNNIEDIVNIVARALVLDELCLSKGKKTFDYTTLCSRIIANKTAFSNIEWNFDKLFVELYKFNSIGRRFEEEAPSDDAVEDEEIAKALREPSTLSSPPPEPMRSRSQEIRELDAWRWVAGLTATAIGGFATIATYIAARVRIG